MKKIRIIIYQFFHNLSWSDLSDLAKNKIVNRTYIYLIIVPLIAKLFYKVESPMKLNIGESIIELNLELPFNWVIFYLSALCFSLGTLIYYWKAPSIIKQNNSLGDFSSSKKTISHIYKYLHRMNLYHNNGLDDITVKRWKNYIANDNIEDGITNINEVAESFYGSIHHKEKIANILSLILDQKTKYPEQVMNASFWLIFNFGNRISKNYIYLSFTLFTLGLAAILYIFIESMVTVAQLIL